MESAMTHTAEQLEQDSSLAEKHAAFMELLHRHEKSIYSNLHQFFGHGHEHDVDDVFEEVMMTLWMKRETFQGESEFATWLWRVVRNAALNYMRKARVRARVATFSQLPESSYGSVPAREIQYLQASECAQHIHGGLSQLRHDYRRCLELMFFEGKTQEEVAQDLERPVNTIKCWLARGKTQMRDVLAMRGIHCADDV